MNFVEITTAVKDIGIPAIFFIIMFLLMFKYFPDFLKERRELNAESQKSFNERNKVFSEQNKTYQDQLIITTKVIEQGNHVIARSNEIISMNTEAIKQSTLIHKEVADSLARETQVLQSLVTDVKQHDQRAEKISIGVEKLLDRTN